MRHVVLAVCLSTLWVATVPPALADRNATLTVVVVRHAEKAADDDRDPTLSAAGELRTQALVEVLADAGVTAIYSTQFKRTVSTVTPLADHLGLDVVVRDIAPGQAEAYGRSLAEHIGKTHAGGTVVVVGHSNTVGQIVYALGGLEVAPISDDEYDHLFILVIAEEGSARLVRSRYGAPSCARTDQHADADVEQSQRVQSVEPC